MNIIVVGAGVVGCALAHELTSRGARVRLVDPRGPGQGATRASAGMLAPHIEGHSPSLLTLSLRSLALYDDFIRRVVSDAGQPVEYERGGSLQVALDTSEAKSLCDTKRALDERHVECSLLDQTDIRRLEPGLSPQVASALLVPVHGYVTAAGLTSALVQAAIRRGAVLSTARVLTVEGAESPLVTTDAGTLEADAVIIAAGSWSPQVVARATRAVAASVSPAPQAPTLSVPVKPIRGQLVQVRLAHRPVSRVVWGSRCYMVPWRDGSVLIGATSEDVGFDERTTEDGVQGLLTAGRQLIPALEAAVFDNARAGLRPMTPDELPLIGRSSTMPHVFYATGHYRNGVLLAPLTASLIANLVLEERESPEFALVRPDRLGL